MKITKWQNGDDEAVCSVREAKKLLKEKGGEAYTLLIDRDGSVQDVAPITLDDTNKASYKNTKTFA